MSSTGELLLPPPKSWDEFEAIVLSAAKIRWSPAEFYRHGRQGQRVDGVDVYGLDAKGRHIGIQGKHTQAGIPEEMVKEEVRRAESFAPALSALFLATTHKRDQSMAHAMRLLSRHRTADRKFGVEILFWEDLIAELVKDEAVLLSHYPQLKPGVSPAAAKPDDRQLFNQLIALLPADGVIDFLDRTNMAGASFPKSMLDPLVAFLRDWNKRERTFADAAVETAKRQLWEKVQEYLRALADETGQDTERIVVPETWEKEQPERFWRVARHLNLLAEELVELHGTLMEIARRTLG
ncbi:MAG: hypothetical protein FJX60_11955 [Alphaproteobacteria bacterium]|nr:hypothetical protein [Alphaproteobacteria bacterium]